MTEQTPVGHWRADEEQIDVYCGRSGYDQQLGHMQNTEIGKRGWLGNPFTLDDHSRASSLAKFRGYFEERLSNDQQLADAVAGLQGKTLGCWCRALDEAEPACHCDIIAEWADRLGEREPQQSSDYPGHRIEQLACEPGEHNLVQCSIPTLEVCSKCGYGLTTLVDQLGHEPYKEDPR